MSAKQAINNSAKLSNEIDPGTPPESKGAVAREETLINYTTILYKRLSWSKKRIDLAFESYFNGNMDYEALNNFIKNF